MGVGLFSYLKTQIFQICALFFISLILAVNIVLNKRLFLARDCSDFAGDGCLYSCLRECRPGSKGIMLAGPSAFSRKAEGWYSFWYQSVSNDAISKESQRAAVSWHWPPCRALNHCWGSISIEDINWRRMVLAIWGCIFTLSLPGCTALGEFLLYFTENIRFNQKESYIVARRGKYRSGNETEIKLKTISV